LSLGVRPERSVPTSLTRAWPEGGYDTDGFPSILTDKSRTDGSIDLVLAELLQAGAEPCTRRCVNSFLKSEEFTSANKNKLFYLTRL
jgi:hypothetical protein